MTQPPSPFDDTTQSIATPAATAWYRRLEIVLACISAFLLIGGSIATWVGLGIYAHDCWQKELAAITARGRPVSEEQAEEMETARITRQYPLAAYLGQAGAFVAVLPAEVRRKLYDSSAFQESYLVVEYDSEGSRPSPEDAAASTFCSLFASDDPQIFNFAKMIRTGEIPAVFLPYMQDLPADMRVLTALARKALMAEILGAVNAVKARETDGPISWEDWYQNTQDNPNAPLIYRFGSSNMYYLTQRNYVREVESFIAMLDKTEGGRTVPMPHQSQDPMLRTGGTTVTSVSTMLDFSAGALGSNIQRLIMAHALFRQEHKRNPRDMNELVEHGGLRDKMLTVEGAQLELVGEAGGGSLLRCTLDPALIDTAQSVFRLLNDYELHLDPVIDIVLYDPKEASEPSKQKALAAPTPATPAPAPAPATSSEPDAPAGITDKENILFFNTTQGRIVIHMRPDLAPRHIERIKELVRKKFYNGKTFHRVIEGFVAQGGDPDGTGRGGSGHRLQAEFTNTPFTRGVIGMARTSDDPNSADSQFFIAFRPLPDLNGKYTVWAEVVTGMEVAEKLARGNPPGRPDSIVTAEMPWDKPPANLLKGP